LTVKTRHHNSAKHRQEIADALNDLLTAITASGTDITIGGDLAINGQYLSVPTATTAALNDVSDAINTDAGKVQGAMVYNTDTDNPVYAVGNADADIWVDGAGNTAHSPS
jgi:hypothetical protein